MPGEPFRGAWYATWWLDGRQVKRKVGPKREPASRQGLTKTQAEARLRELIGKTEVLAPQERMTLKEAGELYLVHVEQVMQRKPSTVQDYTIMLRRHFEPFFTAPRVSSVAKISDDDVRAYRNAKRREGLASKTISNHLAFLHGILRYAVKRKWATTNPVDAVERPRPSGADPDIRFLDMDELEALIAAALQDDLGVMEGVLYLTAAMTGLRQGELIALRWRDVDRKAGVVRVRHSRTRGVLGTPKGRRSNRAVPMSDRLTAAVEGHFQQSAFQEDDALVFAHPQTGSPYDPSKMRSRFKAAVTVFGRRRAVQVAVFEAVAVALPWRRSRVQNPFIRFREYPRNPGVFSFRRQSECSVSQCGYRAWVPQSDSSACISALLTGAGEVPRLGQVGALICQ
jgi:integrase